MGGRLGWPGEQSLMATLQGGVCAVCACVCVPPSATDPGCWAGSATGGERTADSRPAPTSRSWGTRRCATGSRVSAGCSSVWHDLQCWTAAGRGEGGWRCAFAPSRRQRPYSAHMVASTGSKLSCWNHHAPCRPVYRLTTTASASARHQNSAANAADAARRQANTQRGQGAARGMAGRVRPMAAEGSTAGRTQRAPPRKAKKACPQRAVVPAVAHGEWVSGLGEWRTCSLLWAPCCVTCKDHNCMDC